MAKVTAHLGESGYRTELNVDNQTWIADEPLDKGGTDEGPNPVQMLLGALGSCVAITLRLYAERKGWPLEGVDTSLELEKFKAEEYDDYNGESLFVHEIRQQIVLLGPLDAEQRKRLMEIAEKCPVNRIISGPTFVVKELLEGEVLPE